MNIDNWSYGYEIEWGDIDRRLKIPENLGKWEYCETDIFDGVGACCDCIEGIPCSQCPGHYYVWDYVQNQIFEDGIGDQTGGGFTFYDVNYKCKNSSILYGDDSSCNNDCPIDECILSNIRNPINLGATPQIYADCVGTEEMGYSCSEDSIYPNKVCTPDESGTSEDCGILPDSVCYTIPEVSDWFFPQGNTSGIDVRAACKYPYLNLYGAEQILCQSWAENSNYYDTVDFILDSAPNGNILPPSYNTTNLKIENVSSDGYNDWTLPDNSDEELFVSLIVNPSLQSFYNWEYIPQNVCPCKPAGAYYGNICQTDDSTISNPIECLTSNRDFFTGATLDSLQSIIDIGSIREKYGTYQTYGGDYLWVGGTGGTYTNPDKQIQMILNTNSWATTYVGESGWWNTVNITPENNFDLYQLSVDTAKRFCIEKGFKTVAEINITEVNCDLNPGSDTFETCIGGGPRQGESCRDTLDCGELFHCSHMFRSYSAYNGSDCQESACSGNNYCDTTFNKCCDNKYGCYDIEGNIEFQGDCDYHPIQDCNSDDDGYSSVYGQTFTRCSPVSFRSRSNSVPSHQNYNLV